MHKSPVLIVALALTLLVAAWGIFDTQSLGAIAAGHVQVAFATRGWFIMLLTSAITIISLVIAFSRFGRIRLGRDDDEPEFSTVSWFSMMFAAGMGVGLLYWGTAEPLSHFLLARESMTDAEAARASLFVTNFHWGIHAWAIFGITGLVLAYFGFRLDSPQLMSAPVRRVFGNGIWPRGVGSLIDVLAIYAVAIGVAGSIGMGVFQLRDGVEIMLDIEGSGAMLTGTLYAVLCVAFLIPVTVDLTTGMARLSNIAIAITIALAVFVLFTGPTSFILSGIVDSFGLYINDFIQQSFRTYSVFGEERRRWFEDWTLTYMLWWISWAPFVGVFIARISRGRTIREFLLTVMLGPTVFSIFWFGIMGGYGFFDGLRGPGELIDVVAGAIDRTTFVVLEPLPLAMLTQTAVIAASFLFIVTSVVSASLVLAMFASNGDASPPTWLKLAWGVVLAALGLVMILVGDVVIVRSIIAMAALPFVLILPLLFVCMFKALKKETAA